MGKVIDNTNLGYLISKIKAAFWPKTDVIQIGLDNTPISGSDNLVKSGGVYTALNNKQDTLVSGTNIKTINNESLLGSGNISIAGGTGSGEANVIEAITFNGTPATITNKTAAITATIPSEVTESTVSGWGFTKNTGTYSKPSGGIPASDLATGVVPVELGSDSVLVGVETTIKAIEASDGTYVIGSNNADGTEDYVLATTNQIPTESTVSGWGFTKNAAPGTLKTNNTTAQTASASESLSGTINLHKVAKTGTYSDLIGTPTIPAAVTESTVAG